MTVVKNKYPYTLLWAGNIAALSSIDIEVQAIKNQLCDIRKYDEDIDTRLRHEWYEVRIYLANSRMISVNSNDCGKSIIVWHN